MNLIQLLTAPASERYDTLMKVIDRTNKMQVATAKKADMMKKVARRRK